MTPDDRDRLRELAERATPGPWRAFDLDGIYYTPEEWAKPSAEMVPADEAWDVLGPHTMGNGADGAMTRETAKFIAAAHPGAVLALLDDLRDARERAERARIVADHWRRATLEWGEQPMPGRTAAHPLCLVLDALGGETRPEHLGIGPGPDFDALTALAPDETGEADG